MVDDNTMVSDVVSEGLDTIEVHESVRAAQRRMEAQTLRSLIVVDGERPVGVVKWRDLRGADTDATVETCMTTDFPVLRRDMRIPEAHSHLGDVDFDNIPVIDEEGRLIGEVPRGAIVHHETPSDHEDNVTVNGGADTAGDGPHFDLQEDMEVIDAEGGKLGKLSEMSSDPTTHRLSHIVVEHGLLRKKHKRIPADTISQVDEDNNVVLGITKMEWGFLSDVEDQDI